MIKNKLLPLSFVGGILAGLAPTQAPYLAWFALSILWFCLFVNKKLNFLIPLLWGFGNYGLALFWITGVHPMTWMGVPWLASLAIALFCWLFITAWATALVISWSAGVFFLTAKFSKWSPLIEVFATVLVGVALWCGLEALWSSTPLWWPSLAYTQSPGNLPILQLSQFSGPSTITSLLVGVSGLIALSLIKLKRSKILLFIIALSLYISFFALGDWLLNRPLQVANISNPIHVGIIQGNIPNTIKLYPEGWRKAIEGYTKGYQDLVKKGVDVIVTPETALPFVWDEFKNSGSSFYQAILTNKIPAFVGAFGKIESRYTNSLFAITSAGETESRYDKIKLVPLGEYIPFEEILGKLINRLSPLDAQLAKGKPEQIFNTAFGIISVGICYESAFAEHFRSQTFNGGEFIITASNDAHYSQAMPLQHHALDVMRAIESDRYAVRATNTGYSAIVDPHGRTLWISGINTYELHSDYIYRRQTKTFYVRHGDWLTVVLVVLSTILVTLSQLKYNSYLL